MLRIGLPGPLEPRGLSEGDGWLALLSGLVYPGALQAAADGASVPSLAERMTWRADGLGLTIHLRPAKFRDGTAVTAEDVAAAARRFVRAERLSTTFAAIDAMRVVDDRTLEITLHQPARHLPELFESEIYRLHDGVRVGAGDFAVRDASATKVVLERAGPGVGYGRIEVFGFDRADELWKRLLAREVDLVTVLPSSAYATLGRYPWIKRHRTPGRRVWILRWTPRSQQPSVVRRALALAVDREHLARVVGDGFAVVGSRRPSVDFTPADPEGARALLGYRPGDAPVAQVILGYAGSYDEAGRACAVLEADLIRVGIALELRPITTRAVGRVFGDEDLQLTVDSMLLPTDEAPSFEQEVALARMVFLSASSESVCGQEDGLFDPVHHADRLFPCDRAN